MDKFDKSILKKIRTALDNAFDGVVDDLGMPIKLELGGISYSETTFTAKIECSLLGSGGVVQDKERIAYSKVAHYSGLKTEWLDQTFRDLNGRVMKITGFNSRAPKMPVRLEGADGKEYKASAKMVVRNMTDRAISI